MAAAYRLHRSGCVSGRYGSNELAGNFDPQTPCPGVDPFVMTPQRATGDGTEAKKLTS